MVFFTLIENPELLNLHARQKNPQLSNEKSITSSAWMHALCRQMKDNLPDHGFVRLFKKNELTSENWEDNLSRKLDGFAESLGLTPYRNGSLDKKLLPISQKSIQPEYIICPLDMECTKPGCNGRHLSMTTKKSDIPIVTLIKGTSIFKGVSVLTGQCTNCLTLYSAHLQSYKDDPQDKMNHDRTEILSNSARYLQIGRNIWADRNFSSAVVKSMYSFHASANSYCDYWNNTFGSSNPDNRLKLGRRQVWQAFVQESIRTVASSDDVDFETPANLSIDDLTEKAFSELGNGGRMKAAEDHSCSECTKPFKESVTDTTIHPDVAPVKMRVVDGIVMGSTHCAFPGCTSDLQNARGGAFCSHHEFEFGSKCRVVGCSNDKIQPTQACQDHASHWKKNVQQRSQSTVNGIRRILQRPGERQAWQGSARSAIQHPHDEAAPENTQRKNYFSPNRFYCVETVVAPCGVVIAWTKFAKSESPTNILKFLEENFPTEESRPAYICIDKACQVVRTAISNGSWEMWKKTTRFIVDSYHYANHRATDELCRKYCNPAPTDGSAPNLVGQKVDKNGVIHDVREFNTQTCEQLNAWLGGFESILKRMTSKNFDWFMHVMLFYHVKHVLGKLSVVPPLSDNRDDDDDNDNDGQDEESDSSSEDESDSSGEEESGTSNEEESGSSNDVESISSGENDVDLSSDEDSDDNDTENTTTTNSDTDDGMVEEDEDKMEVDDD